MNELAESTAVVVLGMHRSGTSALSGMLAASGYNMGRELFGPQTGVNERGFFENSGAVAINEMLLDSLETQWDRPEFLPDAEALLGDGKLRIEVRRFLADQYAGSERWGLKDPRVSILEPLWTSAIKDMGAKLRCILICRDPFEVADSLRRRDRFPLEKSLMLWMNYNLRSIETAGRERSVTITYRELVLNTEHAVQKIQGKLKLPGFPAAGLEETIEKSLYRSRQLDPGQTPLSLLAQRLYDGMVNGDLSEATVAEIRNSYFHLLSDLSPALISHIEKLSRSELHYRQLFYEAYDSWWWRIAAPLRWMARRGRRRQLASKPPAH